MRPGMLDPERDLKGATPETLARALLRPRKGAKAGIRNKVAKKKSVADKSRNGVAHLVKRS